MSCLRSEASGAGVLAAPGVAGIFVRSAGGLHHAIEGQERLDSELHVNADGAAH
jgi:hypothetical protein